MSLRFKTQIDKAGNIRLPQRILVNLKLLPGTTILIEEKDGKVTLEPLLGETSLIEKEGIHILHIHSAEDILNSVETDRSKRDLTIMKDSIK